MSLEKKLLQRIRVIKTFSANQDLSDITPQVFKGFQSSAFGNYRYHEKYPCLFHSTLLQKDVNTTHRPRRKQPQPLRIKDERFREGGLFSQEGGCGRTHQGTGRGVEVWKPTRRPPSLTTHQSCFHKHSLLTMSHKYLSFHAMPEILLTAREHEKIIRSGFLTPLTLNFSVLYASFCLFLSTEKSEFHSLFLNQGANLGQWQLETSLKKKKIAEGLTRRPHSPCSW